MNGWIHLNVETMPKILRLLIMLKLLLSNVRFSVLFRHLEESTHWQKMESELSPQLLDACTDAVGKPQMVLLLDS